MSRVAEGVLRRQQGVTIAGLATLAILAWLWLAAGSGMGMATRADLLLFPHRADVMPMAMPWDASRLAVTLAMWWVMMIAMMVPAAAPVVLLYARAAPAQGIARTHSGAFVAGYLVCWLLFSAAAVALQILLERADLFDGMSMALTSRWTAGAVLIAAGLYQLSPAKSACLAHCRNPADFLARHFRPGPLGALRMGILHGAYCVGCCWLLMAVLFAVGIMNLAWIALLAILVAAEKLLPHGRRFAEASGILFVVWGFVVLVAG